MTDTVVVFSGGMDSTVLVADCLAKGKKVAAISFDYGSKHNKCELAAAATFCRERGIDHKIISLPFINELFSSTLLQSGGEIPDGNYDEPSMKVTVVPFRNGIMLAIAVGYAESLGAGEVLLASHSGDHYIYPDCRPEFNETFSKAAWLGSGEKIRINFPFAELDKRDIGDLGRRLKVELSRTWTCYKGRDVHCGTCGACRERKYALRYDEGKDETTYER
jgi:7-cyano-7-deazaguanine synthase